MICKRCNNPPAFDSPYCDDCRNEILSNLKIRQPAKYNIVSRVMPSEKTMYQEYRRLTIHDNRRKIRPTDK